MRWMPTPVHVSRTGPGRRQPPCCWLLDGNFVLLGALRCTVGGGEARSDESSRLGVAEAAHEVLPQLSAPDELLVLAQATMPSFLRYGAYPYIVVVREGPGGRERSDWEKEPGGQERSDSGLDPVSSTASWACSPRGA